MTGELQLTV